MREALCLVCGQHCDRLCPAAREVKQKCIWYIGGEYDCFIWARPEGDYIQANRRL